MGACAVPPAQGAVKHIKTRGHCRSDARPVHPLDKRRQLMDNFGGGQQDWRADRGGQSHNRHTSYNRQGAGGYGGTGGDYTKRR
uniref:Uncharacterized protein n=1 Tax=Timema cristinae TaxID=61476 RepID=A0A7R9CS43_TIMCR|nr:unnamed protein product [Timema cristinae]